MRTKNVDRAKSVTQILNLPYRGIAFRGAAVVQACWNISTFCRLRIGDTAECNSALEFGHFAQPTGATRSTAIDWEKPRRGDQNVAHGESRGKCRTVISSPGGAAEPNTRTESTGSIAAAGAFALATARPTAHAVGYCLMPLRG